MSPPSIDDPEILCFKKVSIKDATQIAGGFILILSLLILIFINSVVNFVVIGLIMFVASILLIIGVRKRKTWMFIPFLWSLSGSVFINPISFVICIYYYYTYRNSWIYEFESPERREKYHNTVLITAIINIFGTVLSFWFIFIVQKCYNFICFENTVIPFGNNRKPEFSIEDYIIAEPKYECCFGRFHVKNGTIFISCFSIFCCFIGIIIGYFGEPSPIFWRLFSVFFIIIFTAIGAIIGVLKNESWLILPLLWYFATILFLSIAEFMMIISYAMLRDHSNFSNSIALERKFETLHYKLPINIFIAIFAFWCFSIIHSCYVLLCELKNAKFNPNLNIELAPLHEY